jgi:hypothetical protein
MKKSEKPKELKVRIYMATAKYHWERDILRKWYDAINDNTDIPIDLDYEYGDQPVKNTDVGIVYGGARFAKGLHEVRKNIMDGCRTFIINETPLLGRTITKQHSWHRIGINGHLNGSGDFNSGNSPADRIEKYKTEWNLRFKPWRTDGNYIVLGLQLPGDSSLRKQDLSDWAILTIEQLLKTTNKKIKIRTHPAFSDDDHSQIIKLYQYVCSLGNDRLKFSYGNQTTWDEDLIDCCCVVTYSSGLSIDAIDNGVPVIATDQGNFAYDISSHYPEEINNLKIISEAEKKQWYNNLSYCQWSSEEILKGDPWKHLLPRILEKLNDNNDLS